MIENSGSAKDLLFAFTVDVEPDIPHRVDTYLGLEYVDGLLNLLAEIGIHGTFFVTGDVARSHPDVIKRVKAAGHEVGCHGLEHEPLDNSSPGGIVFEPLSAERKREILVLATQLVAAAASTPPSSFRAPYLSFDAQSILILRELGYTVDSSQSISPGSHRGRSYFPLADGADALLEVPVPVGILNSSEGHTMQEVGVSGFSLRLAGQAAVRRAVQMLVDSAQPDEMAQVVLFSCHPWECVPHPVWRKAVPEYFWWHSDRLLDETRALLEFVKATHCPRFVTLQQIYQIWVSGRV